MAMDYIMDGQGYGEIAEAMVGSRLDPGLRRPFLDKQGKACVIVNTGRMIKDKEGNDVPQYKKVPITDMISNGLVFNAPTSLRTDDWKLIDNAVIRAFRLRLRAWADLQNVSTFGGFNGMGKLMLEYQTMNDPGEAFTDMDGMTEGRNDAPQFNLHGLPLPITHMDFWVSSRQLQVSRETRTPFDTTMAEVAAVRVAERIEKTTVGVEDGIQFGPGSQYGNPPKVYGYINHPDRIVKNDLTKPTDTGWTPQTLVNEILAMIDLASDAGYYGPFMLYMSTDWESVIENDYNANYGGVTTRQRIRGIDSIRDVKRLDVLNAADHPWTLVLVQLTPDVARAVNGMAITTVQWESMGGMRLNFKVMAIQVPQIRSNWNGDAGIVHATAP